LATKSSPIALLLLLLNCSVAIAQETAYIRLNLLGYWPQESKTAIAFSNQALQGDFQARALPSGKVVWRGRAQLSTAPGWSGFSHYYELDFSELQKPGKYELVLPAEKAVSVPFDIGPGVFGDSHETLLAFMRQQRCGYNPFLDMVCHQRDGRSMYGPMPDSTYVDASGGWHDAGDQLKYLITGSYATAHLLATYELYPRRFADRFNALGQPGANGLPDVLDEAKWGLDWLLKLHPAPDQLIHQVADDRDHRGWKMPDQDPSDYGWGPNSYRAAYFATGTPQGLLQYQSKATGVANIAGRSAAALAIAYRIWKNDLREPLFAEKCLRAARTLYQLGRSKEGFQQGNSYKEPYRYEEDTWADDMEWAAAELYRVTREQPYLDDAKRYARRANTVSWMPLDTALHYRYYPFINMGHFALHQSSDAAFQDTLEAYYREGIEQTLARSRKNPYRAGVPFIWCSNNLVTALVTQIILYEQMSGDRRYHDFMLAQRDWLLGRNPWGTSMFMNIPASGEYPTDVHTSIWAKTKREAPGGLVDGPVYASIYRSQRGVVLTQPDEFALFQNDFVVYHDDIGDYVTNEPTMDGTAGALLMMAHWGKNNNK
jgi:hypothetical protein